MIRRRLERRPHGERGQALVLMTVMLVVLLGIMAMVLDVGHGYLMKRRLQAAVDLGSVAAAQFLPDTATAQTQGVSYIQRNYDGGTDAAPTVTATTSCQIAGCPNPDKITFTATAQVSTWFMRLFGSQFNQFSVSASASACGPCDASPVSYDVMVVLDRSASMCSWGVPASSPDYTVKYNCNDLDYAVQGIKSLLNFFNPQTDRVGLTLVSGEDNIAPFSHTGSAAPCDTANPRDALGSVTGKGPYYRSVGDFMDGTTTSHDSWVVAPLANTFQSTTGPMQTALNCVQSKAWTPIAPAIQEAKNALVAAGGTSKKIIVYFGDGGATTTPQQRDSNGNATGVQSWYTWSAGNRDLPCHDAVQQAAAAKTAGIDVYTIAYNVDVDAASSCHSPNGTQEPGITATQTLQQMATDSSHFYAQATPGEVYTIFNKIGHQITGAGTRIVN